MNAEIVAIGSELLLGQIVDTNSAWLAQRLANLGVNLFYKTVVGDNPQRMLEAISQAMERSDVVITSGGLGPTQDDLTREVVAQATGQELVLHPELLAELEQRFRRRGLIMTENNNRQAFIPRESIPVKNPNGTAPSFIVEDSRAVVMCLPGVPFEMKWLFDNEMASYLRRKFDLSEAIYSRVLKVADLGESAVDDRIGHLIANSRNPTVGVLAHPGQVDVRITVKTASLEEADRLIAPLEREVRDTLGEHIFAADDQTLQSVVGALLRSSGLTVASYEGLTGGMVAQQLQEAGGEQFLRGTIGRREEVLRQLVKADNSAIRYEELARDEVGLTDALAAAARVQAGADGGLAVYALPESQGATENLSAGRTHISVVSSRGTAHRSYSFAGKGLPDRNRTAQHALALLRLTLLHLD
jgi:nicotinamide-nucleotide amidase